MKFQLPLIGGILIGLSTSIFLVMNGRLIGISGIIGTFFKAPWSDRYWRLLFIIGLIIGGFVTLKFFPQFNYNEIPTSEGVLLLGSILVGFGTRLGSGCTSGHGVCGISRGSLRSIVATFIFILSAILTVFIIKKVNL